MPHDDADRIPESREEQELNRLLRQLNTDHTSDALWPSAESIVAYIHGGGSSDERNRVQQLLASSSEFRRFVVQTAALIQSAEAPDAAAAFDKVRVPRLSKVDKLVPRTAERFNFSGFLSRILRPRVLVPVLSTAAVMILMLTLTRQSGGPLTIATFHEVSEVDPAFFASATRRGLQEKTLARFALTPDSAALNAFREILTYNWETGESNLDTSGLAADTEAIAGFTLQLIDTLSGSRQVVSFALPLKAADYKGHMSAWMLDAEHHTFLEAPIPNDKPIIRTSFENAQLRILTVTYPTNEGFSAARALPLVRQP